MAESAAPLPFTFRRVPSRVGTMFHTRRNEPAAFHSQRSMALGRNGMVCTSQTLASAAGLEMLRCGGNAVDAAVCAAAVLGVVEPFSTGIGGDCFMLIWSAAEGKLFGLNGSGRAPGALSLDTLRDRGLGEIPVHGMLPVTIPGAVDAWCQALGRFGSRSIAEVLAPAIAYARDGFAVSEIIAHQWDLLLSFGVLRHPDALRTFGIDGRAPRLGEWFRIPSLARSMELISSGGADAFYRGEIAERIIAFSQTNGGVHSLDDFAAHRSTWVEPISTSYRGYEVFEIPPNGQGLTALIALNILENFDVGSCPLGSPESMHLRIEAVKLAFADRNRYIADPEYSSVPTTELLSKDYAHGRAALVNREKALKRVSSGNVRTGSDTVYLTTSDRAGNVVSLINSLYMGFGSGMVAGDTGIVLQNRGYGFVTDPRHPNCLAPRKRPFHTIIPAMVFRDCRPVVSFGVMGGDVQAQGHLQVVSNLIDYDLNIQEAIDYPRFHYVDTDRVALEGEYESGLRRQLSRLGHDVLGEEAVLARGGFGGGQGIMIDPRNGCYWGGSDRRKDGCAIGY
jgi:gamma-glutamyltranspeptidase/glutathione hydrolase